MGYNLGMSTECLGCGCTLFRNGPTGRPPLRCAPCRKAWVTQQSNKRQRDRYNGDPAYRKKRSELYKQRLSSNSEFRSARLKGRLLWGLTRKIEEAGKPPGSQCDLCKVEFLDQNYRRPYYDHNHDTGEFRGWLCRSCNAGLGSFGDRPDLLIQAAEYLRTRGYYGKG